MRNDILRKGLVLGTILLCVTTSIVSALNTFPYNNSTSAKSERLTTEATSQTIMGITLSADTVNVGDTFTATIYLNPTVAVGGWGISLFTFNPAVCHANTVVAGAQWTAFFDAGTINNVNGQITQIQTWKMDTYPDFNHTLCTINFTAQSAGTCTFTLATMQVTDISFVSIPVTTDTATITVGGSQNQPPTFGTPSPANGSSGNLLNLTWSIPINDPDGDAFSWTMECNNGQTNSSTGEETNGTKPLPLSGLAYSTSYKIWVNATDPAGSGLYTRRWYTFTTKTNLANNPPVFATPSPANGSTGNLLSLSWSIPINDPEGNIFTWTIQCSNGQVNSETGASNGTKSLSLSGLAFSTIYKVWVNATDPTGSGLYTRRWYTFTTKTNLANNPPVFATPSPANGSTGNLLNLTWSVPINDPEGDTFSWTLQCNNGQTNNGTVASNGTKSLSLSALSYYTTYKVWVNATDLTASGLYTKKWYTFTTKSSSNGGGGGSSTEPENKKPVADASAGEPYQGFVSSEITFNGSKSYDSDGSITQWLWAFGDNTSGNGKTVRHTYSKTGTFTVTLTVIDNEGATNTDTTTCVITQQNNSQQNRPPTTPMITGTTLLGTKNTIYTYTATSTDPDNDRIQYTFNWGDPLSPSQSSSFLSSGSDFTINHSWAAAGKYNVTVTATDNHSESSYSLLMYINAIPTGEIGYLLDNNGDGIYDTFYSEVLQQITMIQKKDNDYLIDSDGNGKMDYLYNSAQGLISYQEPEKILGFDIVLIIGVIVAIVICSVIVIVLLLRRKGII